MRPPFSFEGDLKRRDYALASIGIYLVQPLFVLIARAACGQPPTWPWWFLFNPLRALVDPLRVGAPDWSVPPSLAILAMTLTVVIDGLLIALAYRRARTAGMDPNLAALAIFPLGQILVIGWLSLAPDRAAPPVEPATANPPPTLRSIAWGLLAGAILCVATVALSTLGFETYGSALFIASPFVIALVTAYLVNRGHELSAGRTSAIVFGALGLGALALIGFAFEGLICLIIASPLIAAMGFFGGLFGRALARGQGRRRGGSLKSVAIVPLLLLGEVVLPPRAQFSSVESVDVAAPPAAVWDSVVHMGPIPDAPPAPFRWGLSYPMRGRIFGSGVGAIRQGVFSTGVAYERVTDWRPNQALSFVVLSDAPTMRELSPYAHVNAPHVKGYFHTIDARFTLTPLADGETRLTLATRHELDLEPALYWIPFAEWATHANKVRVLNHFKQQAEASVAR